MLFVMNSPQVNASRSTAQMASLSRSPIRCKTGRQALKDDGYNDDFTKCGNVPPLKTNKQIDLASTGAADCVYPENEHNDMYSLTPSPNILHFNEIDSVNLSGIDVPSLDSDAGRESESETIEDTMNFPHTTVVPAPVQDFSSLYPSEESIPDEAQQMKSYRQRIQEKLRNQLLAQEKESEVAHLSEPAELYAPQGSYGDGVNGVDDSNVLGDLDGAGRQDTRDAEELLQDLCEEIEPPLPSEDTERGASGTLLKRSLSSTELTSNLSTTFQAPSCLSFSTTPCRKTAYSSRLNQLKTGSPSKRRRKTSSPDEIAELARAAAIEDTEAEELAALEELEKYREMDLAPLEPIMENKTAGDLIFHGTPVKVQDAQIFGRNRYAPESQVLYTPSRPRPKRIRTMKPQTPSRCSIRSLIAQDQESRLALQPSDRHQATFHASHPPPPPFIAVIEALPVTIFWCTAAAIMQCSINTFDALVERLTGLSVKDK